MYSKNLHTMKINKKAVKTFWDQQAKKSNYLRPEGISNLEEDEECREVQETLLSFSGAPAPEILTLISYAEQAAVCVLQLL